MVFKREYKGGGADHDPRQKHYFVYVCNCCGHEVDLDVTARSHTIDKSKERECPKCHQKSPNDYVNVLKVQLEVLTQAKNKTEIEIEKTIREIEEFSKKVVV
jgi:hypothetical protein